MGRSENGWIDSQLFVLWLKKTFLPSLVQRQVRMPVLLLVDGHKTHCSLEAAEVCRENNIILYLILAHASHVLQPLDKGFFAPLKKNYEASKREFQRDNPDQAGVTKRTFSRVLKTAWDKITVSSAVGGFLDTGIFPFNPSKPDMTKLQPSSVYKSDATAVVSTPSPLPAINIHNPNENIPTASVIYPVTESLASDQPSTSGMVGSVPQTNTTPEPQINSPLPPSNVLNHDVMLPSAVIDDQAEVEEILNSLSSGQMILDLSDAMSFEEDGSVVISLPTSPHLVEQSSVTTYPSSSVSSLPVTISSTFPASSCSLASFPGPHPVSSTSLISLPGPSPVSLSVPSTSEGSNPMDSILKLPQVKRKAAVTKKTSSVAFPKAISGEENIKRMKEEKAKKEAQLKDKERRKMDRKRKKF